MMRPPETPGGDERSPAQYAMDTLCYIEECLQDIRKNTAQDEKRSELAHLDRPFIIETDGAGNGQAEIFLLPGASWTLQSYAAQVDGAAQGYLAFYRDQEVGTGLLKVVALATLQDDVFTDGHYIPEQSRLLVVARGLSANSKVSGRVSAKGATYGRPIHTTHSEG